MTKEVDHVPALDAVKSELAAKKKLLIDEMRTNLFYLVFKQPIALTISEKHNCFTPDIADQLSDFYLPNLHYSSFNDDSVFGSLPLSDWRSLSSDAPEVDSSLFKDPQAFATNLSAKRQMISGGGSTRDSRSSRFHGRGDRSGDFMITDKKQWAESIVALTHCLHRLQKLSQAFYTWRMKVQNVEANGVGAASKSSRNVNEIFSPGGGLITEIHNSITLPAIAEVERILAAQGETSPASTLADPTCLVELLQLLFPAFCMHFNAFMLVLNTIKKIRESTPSVSFQFLDALSEQHIWGYIQMEVQSILSAHLSSQKGLNGEDLFPSSVAAAANFNASKLDLNALMGKKRGAITNFLSNVTGDSNTEANGGSSSATGGEESTLAKNGESFFSFSKTAHSLSLNSYLRENRINMPFGMPTGHSMEVDGGNSGGGISMELTASYPTVCRPCADNVKVIYSLVLNFARMIELQPVSAQNAMRRVLDGESNSTDAEADVQASYTGTTTSSGRRQPPLIPGRRSNQNSISSASVTQGLRIALLAMGAPKMLPQNGDTKPQNFELPALDPPSVNMGREMLQVRCQLRVFLTNFIEQLYLPNAEIQLQQPIISAVSSQDALTMIVPQQTQRELGLQRPILMVAYLTNQALGETKGMATALPNYMVKCAQIGLSILEKFVSWASSVYKNISVAVGSGAVIPSAEWARDKDLSRFWTNFPVWQRLMAADAFATASTTHTVGNPHDPQLGNAAAIVLGLSNLGLNGRSDPTFTGGLTIQAIPFANSALGQGDGIDGASDVNSVRRISKHDDILLHERETTRLARKEMDNLLHIIRDEVGSSTEFCLPTAGMLTVKSMGRLRESVHWLELCVQNWLSWLEGSMGSDFNIAPFAAVGEELTALANATLLSIYLDVRVQAYNLLANLPRTANFWCPVDEVDVDPEITKCLVYWDQLQESIVHSYCPHEIRFIFDGLGDFISQIFLRLIPQITRMNVNGNRKMCRNIYKLQQTLALLTENHESDLIRVKQLYELFYLTPESVVNKVIEQGVAFEVGVYQNLLRLYQRSHPSHDHSRTDDNIAKLSQIIRV
nr:exocyst componenet sec8 [Hymenolepis microstoma]